MLYSVQQSGSWYNLNGSHLTVSGAEKLGVGGSGSESGRRRPRVQIRDVDAENDDNDMHDSGMTC